MARKTYTELVTLKKQLNIDTLWSWSRYNCFKNDKFEYFLKYILHKKEDRNNGIYAVSGGYAHDIIEKFYQKEIKKEDMLQLYEDNLFTMNLAELKYDRSDNEKNEKIAYKYENCLRHFFKNHIPIEFPNRIEHFLTIKIANDIYMQGYIDFLHTETYKDENNKERKKIVITDWKTSTIYKGKKIDKESGQLLIYGEGIRQALKTPLEDIVVRWNFLKYVTVNYLQANGKWKRRDIERHVIGENLINIITMWLKKEGFDEIQIDEYMDKVVLSNDIECLPDCIKEKIVISDCYVEVPLTEEKIQSLKNDIVSTVSEITEKEKEYNEAQSVSDGEKIFWQDVTDQDAFRIGILSGYSRRLHKPYDEYLKNIEMFKNKDKELDADSDEDDLLSFLDSL